MLTTAPEAEWGPASTSNSPTRAGKSGSGLALGTVLGLLVVFCSAMGYFNADDSRIEITSGLDRLVALGIMGAMAVAIGPAVAAYVRSRSEGDFNSFISESSVTAERLAQTGAETTRSDIDLAVLEAQVRSRYSAIEVALSERREPWPSLPQARFLSALGLIDELRELNRPTPSVDLGATSQVGQ